MPRANLERSLQIAIGVLLVALGYVAADSLREKVVDVNDTAPDFTIATDNGRTLSRSNFGGKLLVVNFWATWCPPCIEEMPSLDQFQRRFAGSGVVVLGISVDQSERAYRDLLRKAGVSFLTARDPEGRISASYGTSKYPESYVIDQRGKVVQKIIGPTNWTDERMISYIQSLL
jgi:cytochrome c biogenesis protein CcmG, thiol:disulfide interchange protein DsbE